MKTGIVLEGGALRGIFTSGVIDCFLLENISFDYAIGVSAGAGNITGFKSGQVGRTANVIAASKDNSYLGIAELIHSRKYLNLDKMFDVYGKHPLDFDAYFSDKTEAEFTVCCCETGEAEYLREDSDPERLIDICKASCSLPMLCAPVEIDGKHYLDGGIGYSIPCDRAMEMGCDKLVVVLTKAEGVSPGDYSKYGRIIRHMYPQYPKFWQACEERIERYEKSVEYMKTLEREGKAVVIRPISSISKFERDNAVLRSFYKHGYTAAKHNLAKIKSFLAR